MVADALALLEGKDGWPRCCVRKATGLLDFSDAQALQPVQMTAK